MPQKKHIVIIEGATGVGKTSTGIELARCLGTEIVSTDSRQVYRELSIGTAKPSPRQLAEVNHHMVDIVSIGDYYNAYMFAEQAQHCIRAILETRDVALAVGGSGLYISALCHGIDDIPDIDPGIRAGVNEMLSRQGIVHVRSELKIIDPEYYAIVDLNNPARLVRAIEVFRQTGRPYSSFRTRQGKRLPWDITKIALSRGRDELYERINQRVDEMISSGLEAEARLFHPEKERNALRTVGYKELFDHFEGKTSMDEAVNLIKQNTRHYAKKQLSWFKRDEGTTWIHADDINTIINTINERKNNANTSRL